MTNWPVIDRQPALDFGVRQRGRWLVAACLVTALGLGCDHPKNPTSPTSLTVTSLTVTSVFPGVAPSNDAAAVKVNGTGFLAGASVGFGGQAATVTAVSGSQLSVTTPVSAPGRVDVVVTNPDGQEARLDGGFTFLDLAVTSMSESEGLPFDFMTIWGAGFRSGVRVLFDGVEATLFSTSIHEIRLFAPLHAPGTVDVAVTNPDGRTVTLPAGFTYQSMTLSVSANAVAAGGPLSITWATSRGFSDFDPDFIGLYRVGAPNDRRLSVWEVEIGVTTGTANLTAPAQPGDYEFRYLMWGAHLLATTPVTVVGTGHQRP